MNNDESIVKKLNRRFDRLRNANVITIRSLLKQYLKFIRNNRQLSIIIDVLTTKIPDSAERAQDILNSKQKYTIETFADEKEHCAIAYQIISICDTESTDSHTEVMLGLKLEGSSSILSDGIMPFVDYIVAPVHEYILEQIENKILNLDTFLRYKSKCEWFQREKLYELWKDNKPKGENVLAKHMYEFLFDSWLPIVIEPSSASGKTDMLSKSFVADVKVFSKHNQKDYICKGFNQVYKYLHDYNKQIGYLIIFRTIDIDLKFLLNQHSSGVQYLVHNNKTIYVIVINISGEPTASKAGKIKVVRINESDIVFDNLKS